MVSSTCATSARQKPGTPLNRFPRASSPGSALAECAPMAPRSCATCWLSAKCALPRVLRTAASPVGGGDTTAGCAGAVCVLPTAWDGASAQGIKHRRVSATSATSCRREATRKPGGRGSSLGRRNCTLLMGAIRLRASGLWVKRLTGAIRRASGLWVKISCGHRWVRRPMGPACCARSSRTPGAQLELRACDRAGTLLHRIAIDEIVPPKKDAQNSPTPSPSTGTAEKRSTTPTKTQIISTKKVDAISCSGSWAAVQRNDKGQTSIQVFELPTGKRLGKLTSTEDTAVAMAVHSGQNGFLCTGGQNGVLRVWSVPHSERQCSLVCMLTGHSDLIIDMAIAGNGAYICSGSKDKTLRLWKRNWILWRIRGE